MGAQANCCKQPEGVIEEKKYNTLDAAANGNERLAEKKNENQNDMQYNSEFNIYANPICQADDGTGKIITPGVDPNLFNQYFQTNNNQNLQNAENQGSYEPAQDEENQEPEQQQQQYQLEQNDQQVDQQQDAQQYQQVDQQQDEQQYQLVDQQDQQIQQDQQEEAQKQGEEMQEIQEVADAAAGSAEVQQNQLNQNNENTQVQQGEVQNYGGYQFQPVQVIRTVKPDTYVGPTIAKTNVLSPITQPVRYDNNVLTNIEGMIQGTQEDLSAFGNIQTPENAQYTTVNAQVSPYVPDNVQASQYAIPYAQPNQYGAGEVTQYNTGEVAQYTDKFTNQYVTGAQTAQYSPLYNYNAYQTNAASKVNYASSSFAYAQPMTSSTQSYQYSTSYQLPTTTTTSNYASYNVQGMY